MRGAIQTSLLLTITLAVSCVIDSRGSRQGDVTMETAYGGLTYGGETYGDGVVRYRGSGNVKSCTAGPAGVLLPNRFVYCYCDQLVKDCGQDDTCTTCNNSRYLDCASTSWFSSPSYIFGSCYLHEQQDCAQYCQQNCTSGCAME